jgi:HTH-type transcriptional regulator / antitoxin HigA
MSSTPAEVFPVGEYLEEEMEERGWSSRDVAERMGGDVSVNECAVDLILNVSEMRGLRLGKETAEGLARAFGTSAQFWTNLDNSYHQHVYGDGPYIEGNQ